MISLLDTNVLIRFLTADESSKYKTLYAFFQSLEQGQMRVELKLIVLFQVIFVLKGFYKVPKKQIVDGMKNILSIFYNDDFSIENDDLKTDNRYYRNIYP